MTTSTLADSMMLNQRQEKFVEMYVADPNGTKAAINSGYARTYAGQTAYKLLQDPRIQRRIEEKRAKLRSNSEITPERLIEQYRRIALTNPTDLMTDDGVGNYRFKRPDELTDDEKALIQDVSIQTKTTKSPDGNQEVIQSFTYKLATRKEALDSLARVNGMFRDKVDHEHKHQIDALFEFIAQHPERSETTAIIRRRYGRDVIEGEAREVEDD